MEIKIIKKSPIKRSELLAIAKEGFGDMVKAVVDLEKEIMAIGGELHADEEVLLMEQEESKRENTWGINIYPEKTGNAFIEFNSMVNIKPMLGNRSREVGDPEIQKKIRKIISKLVIK